ncbi:MAG: hypothetical protein LBS45_08975 [Synergistaceae bacterium]|nr:hypothetical protein [Synergistaceae bacterium]
MVWHDDIFTKTYAGIHVMIGTPGAVRKQRDAEGGVPYGNSRHIRRYDGRARRGIGINRRGAHCAPGVL